METFLAGLPESDRAMLKHASQIKCFEAGELIIREGTQADGLYLVAAGQVEVFREVDGGETILGHVGAGEVFGEMGLVDESRLRQASVRAASQTHVLLLPSNPVLLINKYGSPEGARHLLQSIIEVLVKRVLNASTVPVKPKQSLTTVFREWRGADHTAQASERLQKRLKQGAWGSSVSIRKYKKGERIFRFGEPANEFLFLSAGKVATYADESSYEPGAEGVHQMAAPMILGECDFSAAQPHKWNSRALEESQVIAIEYGTLDELWKRDPQGAIECMYVAAQLLAMALTAKQS